MSIGYYFKQAWLGVTKRSSADYWERRYRAGLTSGSGSYGALAEYKAAFLNEFVAAHSVRTVMEFGCGDGNQLALARYPLYLGLDVSPSAVAACAARFAGDPTKSFLWYDASHAFDADRFLRAELTLSLDVVYHLLEDAVYRAYLRNLFRSADRYVIVYSSDRDDASGSPHVRHHRFTEDVASSQPEFRLVRHVENPHRAETFADFFVFERMQKA